MSLRVRDRGPRRRCSSNQTLVRTIPSLQREPPPIPLSRSVYRHYTIAEVSDYEGIATDAWTSGTQGTNASVPPTDERALIYHHFTVSNQRTDSYDAILPPVRWSPMAPATDGGNYDGWQKPGNDAWIPGGPQALRVFRPSDNNSSSRLEVAQEVCPTDSHCEIQDYSQCVVGSINAIDSFVNNPALNALSSNSPLNQGLQSGIYAFRFRVNGSPVGSLTFGGISQLRAARVPVAKGDIVEVDVWLRVSYTPDPTRPAIPGKGVVGWYLSYVSSTAPLPILVGWNNINMVPDFDKDSQTYAVTISGHLGWTLKDGSDGPHPMKTGDGWTRSVFSNSESWGAGMSWSKAANSASFILRYDSEIPLLVFEPGTLFGSNQFARWFYRPRNQTVQPYRKTTVMKATYNPDGSTNAPAGTVTHGPSGPWAQGGSTIFDRVSWNNDLGGYMPGRSGLGATPVILEQPTSITLTRVSL